MIPIRTERPLVDAAEIAEIELFVLKRMREFTLGEHAGAFKGAGFDFVGVRDWQPGDRLSTIDWAQSSLTNFSPLITREFDQNSTATIVAVADASLSTLCGAHGSSTAVAVARAVAAIGFSAVFFQDSFGLIAFDERFRQVAGARPRLGKPHVLHCIELYQRREDPGGRAMDGTLAGTIEGHLRKTTVVPVVSDFLFAGAPAILEELSLLNTTHDVFLVMADARQACQLPAVSAGWVEIADVETGQTLTISSRELGRMADRIEEWQQRILRLAQDADLDIVRVGLDRWEMETTLVEFAAERRLRKTT